MKQQQEAAAAKAENLNDMEMGFEPAPNRRAARQPSRDSVRDTMTVTPRKGAVVVEGRDGEILTRRRTQVGDRYDVPSNEIPDGWSYQWNPVTVTGKEVIEIQNEMHANGWRPVPASRHPGRWTRPGDTGHIVVEGLRLEERPEALTQEALIEEEKKARRQVRDQSDILKLSKKMPEGFSMEKNQRAGRLSPGGSINISVDRSMDIAPSDYQYPDE